MPTEDPEKDHPVTVTSCTIEQVTTRTICVDFEADLSQRDSTTLLVPLPAVPLPGKWSLEIKRGPSVKISMCYGRLAVGELSLTADIDLRVQSLHPDGTCTLVKAGNWSDIVALIYEDDGVDVGLELAVKQSEFRAAEQASAGTFSLAKHRMYRVILELKEKQPQHPHAPQQLAQRNPDTTHTPVPNDARLFFPRVSTTGAELWTTSGLLSSSSPYLKDLLASDFAESIAIGSKRRRVSSTRGAEPLASKDFEDSDDDMDEWLFENELPTLFAAEDGVEFTYRQITVKHAAYSTYCAVLRYLATGLIRFAPLTSSCLPSNPSAPRTRRGYISDLSLSGIDPSALLVSPKSVYRLAHLLQLDDLQRAALAAFKGSLSPTNAAAELFDNALVLYDEWRNVALAFVVHHFDEINEAPSWIEMMERIERDEVPGAAGILVKLASQSLLS
ncbi:hypothetical protein JCM10450v2_004892 [Rhodotorula kratochvilovae]